MTKITLVIALASALLLSAPAHAAQDATVTIDQAAIRERPEPDAKIIESRPAGVKIKVSTYNKNGWYKTKTSSGQYGWVWQADIEVLAFNSDVKAANLDLKEKPGDNRRESREPWLFFRAGGLLFSTLSSDISSRLGAGKGHWYYAPGGFAEVAVRLDERLRAAVRLASYSASGSVSFNSVGYSVGLSSTPLLVGLEADVSRGDTFDISAGFYGGLGLNTTASAVAGALSSPNSFSISASSYALLINFSAKYYFKRWLCAVGELGFFYTQIPSVTVPNAFNGDTPFRDTSGNLATLHVNQIGPMLGAGVQLSL